MKALTLILSLCAMTAGCMAVRTSAPNPWLPWNWGKGDPVAKVQKAEEQVFTAKVQLAKQAQGLVEANNAELQSDPKPDDFTARAIGYGRRAAEDLAQALGPLSPADARNVDKMVSMRQSADPAEKASGDELLATIDRISAVQATALAIARDEVQAAHEAEAAAYARARIAEEKWDRAWFWLITAGIAYLVWAWVLPLIGDNVPQLAMLRHAGCIFSHTALKTLRAGAARVAAGGSQP